MVTVHDFLSRLVADPHARSVFDADPLGALEQAGLGLMSNTELAQASSLMLDNAPIEVVEDYARALSSSLTALVGAHEHVALTYLKPLTMNDPDGDWEISLPSLNDFTSLGDVDEMLRPSESGQAANSNNSTENTESQDTQASNNPVGSGNEVQFDSVTGDINAAGVAGDINGLANSGDANLGNIAGNGVTDAVGDIQGGDTMGQLGDVAGAGDLTGGLSDLGGVSPAAEDISGALPVEAPQDLATNTMAPITGAEGPVGAVEDTAGGLTAGDQELGGLGL